MLKIVAEIEGVAIKENMDHHMDLNFELNMIIKTLTNLKKKKKKNTTKTPKSP